MNFEANTNRFNNFNAPKNYLARSNDLLLLVTKINHQSLSVTVTHQLQVKLSVNLSMGNKSQRYVLRFRDAIIDRYKEIHSDVDETLVKINFQLKTQIEMSRTPGDQARRAFRHAMETVKSLDDIAKRKSTNRDLFSTETIFYRNRLKDYCERLMFHDPLEFGRKAEDLLWRKVFYEPIQSMKQIKKNTKLPKNLVTSYQTHLMAAAGFYNHLLFRIQYEFKMSIESVTDCYYRRYSSAVEFEAGNSKQAAASGLSWAEKAIHRCLVYLGDLARYMKEYDGNRSWVLAQRYYYQALHYQPDNGMPHNQLGTLVGTRYYGLDAAYHYIRCVASPSKFQGASANLRRVFDLNQKRYRQLMNGKSDRHKELSVHQQRILDIKSFCIKFLHLMDILYNLGGPSSTTSIEPRELQTLCQTVLKEFDFVLFHPLPEDSHAVRLGEEKMAHLEDEMVFKIVVLITIVVHKLQYQGIISSILLLAKLAIKVSKYPFKTSFYEAKNPSFPPKTEPEDASTTFTDNPAGINHNSVILSDEDLDRKIKQKLLEEERREASYDDDDDEYQVETDRKLLRSKRRRRRRTDEDLSEGEDEVHQDEVLTMISDDEEELNFLTGAVDSSSSDDEDNLAMVSQELKSGFLDSANSEMLTKYSGSSNSMSLHNLLSTEVSNRFVGNEDDLQQISSDLLSVTGGLPQPPYTYNSSVDDIAQGKKQVSVPPGFDKDPEVHHVDEISRKLADFTIDTDTNSSIHTGSDHSDDTDIDSVIDRNETREKQFSHVLAALADQGLLCVIKVLCDWLICQPQIISTCTQSSPMLWSRLSYFLNFLPLESMIKKQDLYASSELWSHIENLAGAGDRSCDDSWQQTYPMREDINMYKLPVMSEAHAMISFDKEIPLGGMEEALLRICCLRNFGYKMAKLTGSSFTYNKETSMFFGPQLDSSNQDQDAQVKMEDEDARKNQLMKDMAQLRLQTEISQLKDSIHSNSNRNLPPYLVPDSSALLDTMHLIKRLVYSSKFIIIIPLCVIDQLDSLKKEHVNARNAIRWLEAEFGKGNIYIRVQKTYERMSPNSQHNLKRKDKDLWRILQIIDCCKYLSKQSEEWTSFSMVSVLTNVNFSTNHVSPKVRQKMRSGLPSLWSPSSQMSTSPPITCHQK
ncbi:SMG5 [Bugula neritina]|uniref:SMG5 n=1 Tax=Bugula neritina TaxID=10212 RepID=A0A7J7KLT7_BUGNE|nr:SMG5 [Bugula neritina]